MKIANEQINDLKKKLSEVEKARGVAKWVRDEALRAKTEVEFAKTEAESSKDKDRTAFPRSYHRPSPEFCSLALSSSLLSPCLHCLAQCLAHRSIQQMFSE